MGIRDKGEEWVLRAGSHKDKQPWELKFVAKTGGEYPVEFLPGGFLGWTSTQARDTIRLLHTAWEFVHNKQGE